MANLLKGLKSIFGQFYFEFRSSLINYLTKAFISRKLIKTGKELTKESIAIRKGLRTLKNSWNLECASFQINFQKKSENCKEKKINNSLPLGSTSNP